MSAQGFFTDIEKCAVCGQVVPRSIQTTVTVDPHQGPLVEYVMHPWCERRTLGGWSLPDPGAPNGGKDDGS